MDAEIQKEFEELKNLPEAERDENQQTRFDELNKQAETEKTEGKSKELQSALAQKEHWREKAEKAENKIKELQTKGEIATSTNPMDIVKLAKALEGNSEEEIEFIARNAADKSIDGIIEASKDEMVQIAIKGKREKVSKETKVPGPSSASALSGEKSLKDIKNMTREEHKEWAEEQMRKATERGEGI